MNSASVRQNLISFIQNHATTQDLQFKYLPERLNKSQIASYLLLVASVNQGVKADTIGEFIRRLWDNYGPRLFEIGGHDRVSVLKVITDVKVAIGLSRPLNFDDVTVLRSAASYLNKAGDMLKHAQKFSSPGAMVDDIGSHIIHFGRDPSGARKKAWMYMRWMVRSHPDLRIFENFQPKDLEIPLDRNTCRAFAVIRRLLPENSKLTQMVCKGGVPQANATNRHLATEFARSLFPKDPAIIDYPLFLLGRGNNIERAINDGKQDSHNHSLQ